MIFDGSVPLTGIAFCYAPLLLTILGFIFFAALTDADARRRYLRRSVGPKLQLTRPMIAETPAGAEVMLRPPNGDVAVAAPPAPAKEAPAPEPEPEPEVEAPPQAEAVEPEPDAEDDLKQIVGIGPKTEEALKASGIKTFGQIAEMDADELLRIVKEDHGVRVIGGAEPWVKQAEFIMNDDVDGLRAYQDSLSNGEG